MGAFSPCLVVLCLCSLASATCWNRLPQRGLVDGGNALNATDILQHTAAKRFACKVYCLLDPCCNTINYHDATGNCVLGYSTEARLSKVPEGWSYMQKKCLVNHCLNNAVCVVECLDGKEADVCHCRTGSHGRRCHVTQACSNALGMENHGIPSVLVTASSSADETRTADRARLNMQGDSWAAAIADILPWLRVELLFVTNVTGVVTQGGGGLIRPGWVTRFRLLYDGAQNGSARAGLVYKDFTGKEKVFQGNVDESSVKRQFLDPIIQTRSLTFDILEWHDSCSMRVEILGCRDEEWLLAFKGRAENGASIFNAWTGDGTGASQAETDRDLNSSRHYRDNTVFHLWNELSIREVQLSVYTVGPVEERVVMRFQGKDSDVQSWFGASRILQSPWIDLQSGSNTYQDSMAGIGSERRFLMEQCVYNGCHADCGWLAVVECEASCSYACPWETPISTRTAISRILFCTKQTVCYWNDVGVALADALTIHIKF